MRNQFKVNIKVGDKITLYENKKEELDDGRKTNKYVITCKKWTVEELYPAGALLVDKLGIHEFFTWWYLSKHMKKPVLKDIYKTKKPVYVYE